MLRWLRVVALIVGVAAFAVMAHRLGWAGITQVLVQTGWWFVVIAAIDVTSALCDGAAIKVLASEHARVPYARAVAAQLGGVAINRVTPGNALGEPIKISLLVEKIPRDSAVSTVLMFDASATIVAITAIVIGIPITLAFVDLPTKLAAAAWIGAAALVLLLGLVLVLVRRGPVRIGIGVLRRLRLVSEPRAARWRATTAHIDDMVEELGMTRSSRLGIALLFGSRFFNWVGTVVMLYAAGLPVSVPMVVGLLSVGALVTYISHIVPLGIGIAEGGNYLLYRALGAPGLAGLDFTMVYRARTCLLAAIGLGVLAIT
ncbi:MAG TPA: flippase-like domain-containing protein, partial [Kofleriaceae bacterium]|nr:flippase-like domain-containing protein [Kofleriaceae bacterium]